MKTIATFLLLTFAAINITFSQNNQENRNLEPFNKIRVNNKINVYVSNDSAFVVKVEATGIEIDNVITEVKDSTLTIELSKGTYKDYAVDLYLSCSQIVDAYVKSGGRISFQDTLIAKSALLTAGSKASIDAGVNLTSVEVVSENGGIVNISGKAMRVNATTRTGGVLSALQLVSDTAYVSVATKGLAKVNVSKFIEANIRSLGTLTLTGSPASKNIKTGIGATLIEQ